MFKANDEFGRKAAAAALFSHEDEAEPLASESQGHGASPTF
jgi:hypothetical protein